MGRDDATTRRSSARRRAAAPTAAAAAAPAAGLRSWATPKPRLRTSRRSVGMLPALAFDQLRGGRPDRLHGRAGLAPRSAWRPSQASPIRRGPAPPTLVRYFHERNGEPAGPASRLVYVALRRLTHSRRVRRSTRRTFRLCNGALAAVDGGLTRIEPLGRSTFPARFMKPGKYSHVTWLGGNKAKY